MTKREQRLLMICLAALALVVDLRLLILPALEERRELTDTLQDLTAEQTLRRSRIESLEYIDGAIVEKEQALAVASAPYYTYLSTEEMDRIVTELLLRHDFFPQQLRLEEGRAGATQAYLSSERIRVGPGYDGIPLCTLAEDAPAEEITERGQQYLYTASVSFTAQGENWLALLDDVAENDPAIRVAAFELGAKGDVEGTLVFSMYGP